MVTVRIPSALRPAAGGEGRVPASGGTVGDVLDDLIARFPGLRGRLLDDEGRLRRFVNVFVDGEDVRHEGGLARPVGEGQEISIVPSVAGG
ncbi:MAG: MoaD/ThiS family protein [Actinobacteria bacterium]|nr:MoaD/ThiS family protein [Actinomycetota bacterium]